MLRKILLILIIAFLIPTSFIIIDNQYFFFLKAGFSRELIYAISFVIKITLVFIVGYCIGKTIPKRAYFNSIIIIVTSILFKIIITYYNFRKIFPAILFQQSSQDLQITAAYYFFFNLIPAYLFQILITFPAILFGCYLAQRRNR